MHLQHPVRLGLIALALLLTPCAALAPTEPILTDIGADTVLTFAHASVPGAKGIDFRFTGAFSPMYPDTESHLWRSISIGAGASPGPGP